MTQIAKTGLGNAQSALVAANDLRAAMQGVGIQIASSTRYRCRHKAAQSRGLEHELLNREEQQKWDSNRGIRLDCQRLSLISCRFGLNSFLNIDRSVK
jgi:hypothetical protein